MSQIVSPLGERLGALGTDEAGVARGEVDLTETERQYTPQNHLFNDRRPEAYRL